MFWSCLEDHQMSDEIEGVILDGLLPTNKGRACLGLAHFVHHGLPGALRDGGVRGGQIRPADLDVQQWLLVCFVARVQEPLGNGRVSCLEAFLFSSAAVLEEEDAAGGAAEQAVFLLHGDHTPEAYRRSGSQG